MEKKVYGPWATSPGDPNRVAPVTCLAPKDKSLCTGWRSQVTVLHLPELTDRPEVMKTAIIKARAGGGSPCYQPESLPEKETRLKEVTRLISGKLHPPDNRYVPRLL